jgi:hypothetical protein
MSASINHGTKTLSDHSAAIATVKLSRISSKIRSTNYREKRNSLYPIQTTRSINSIDLPATNNMPNQLSTIESAMSFAPVINPLQ